jgi:probable F420-dependent oxidoreductase
MKVGIFVPLVGSTAEPRYLAAAARAADESGFHSLWVAEHVVLFDHPESKYPYSADGAFPVPAESGMLEPFAALAFAAALTTRIRLGTGICLVPQRQVLYSAKSVADLDVLSGGRVEFGVGIGWQEEEFEALGVPFERRGARCREYLEAMKRLWMDETSSFDGSFVRFAPLRFYPKPVQRPHPPITFGGESDPALARVAALGQGWFGFNIAPDEVAGHMKRLDAALAKRGRSRREISVKVSPYLKPGADPDGLRRYHAAGVDEVIVPVMAAKAADVATRIGEIGRTLLPVAASL